MKQAGNDERCFAFWNQFRNPDLAKIKKALMAPILFDGRNLYSPTLMAAEGFAYFCVGR
jgi:UDPglucose 6-dehydrogenase